MIPRQNQQLLGAEARPLETAPFWRYTQQAGALRGQPAGLRSKVSAKRSQGLSNELFWKGKGRNGYLLALPFLAVHRGS